ncbi:MAG TPA: glycosyltransferase family 4 protein [Acidimicrobiia bacterium]
MTEHWTIAPRSADVDTQLRVVAIDSDDAPSALGLERDALLTLAMLWEPDDLVVAIVPALLRTRLGAGADSVVYVDARARVDASLDPFARLAVERGAAFARGDDDMVRVAAVGARAQPVLDHWVSTLASLDPGTRRAGEWVDELVAAGLAEELDVAPEIDRSVAAPAFASLPDGTPIDRTMRAAYRDGLHAPGADPPNPLAGEADAFVRWLRAPVLPDIAPRVGRYLARRWSDSELLRDEYPELEPETAEAYEQWSRDHGSVPACVLPTDAEQAERRARRRAARPAGPRAAGVNVVGYLGAALGLGEVARNLVDALREAGVPVAAVTNPATDSRDLYEVDTVAPDDAPYDVNLFVVTADMLAPLAGRLGPGFLAERRNIGLWFWEADRFRAGGPTPATVLLDEVWAPSAFVRGAIDAAAPGIPVETVPVPVSSPAIRADIDRAALGLPADAFAFLFMFDYFSVVERKNPVGLVDAYRRAFAPDDGAVLVLKSINGARRADDVAALRRGTADRPDIIVLDEYLSPDEHAAMLARCDAYVSLHRAEGLGLTMAEAMSIGKPVVATAYSGNLEFMEDDVAFLVDSTLVPIGAGVDPYPADGRWAEPDVEHAAALMRKVFDDPAHAAAVGRRASDRIRSRWSASAVAPRLRELVDQARARPRDPAGSWREFFMRGWRNRLLGPIPRQYRFDWLADGFPFDRSAHTIYTFSLQRALARHGRGCPPDPDAGDATPQMLRWLNTPIAPRRRPVVSRYLVQYWHDHPELHERFPGIESDRAQARAYRDWVADHWHDETDVDYRLVPGQ